MGGYSCILFSSGKMAAGELQGRIQELKAKLGKVIFRFFSVFVLHTMLHGTPDSEPCRREPGTAASFGLQIRSKSDLTRNPACRSCSERMEIFFVYQWGRRTWSRQLRRAVWGWTSWPGSSSRGNCPTRYRTISQCCTVVLERHLMQFTSVCLINFEVRGSFWACTRHLLFYTNHFDDEKNLVDNRDVD